MIHLTPTFCPSGAQIAANVLARCSRNQPCDHVADGDRVHYEIIVVISTSKQYLSAWIRKLFAFSFIPAGLSNWMPRLNITNPRDHRQQIAPPRRRGVDSDVNDWTSSHGQPQVPLAAFSARGDGGPGNARSWRGCQLDIWAFDRAAAAAIAVLPSIPPTADHQRWALRGAGYAPPSTSSPRQVVVIYLGLLESFTQRRQD